MRPQREGCQPPCVRDRLAVRRQVSAAYHGRQRGRVYLADRAVRVERPRLRSAGDGELAIPAYEALRRPAGLGERMLELLLAGLSTRSYGKANRGDGGDRGRQQVLGESAGGRGGGGERLKELAERRLDDRDYLIVYLDGIQFGGHHILAALGVDDEGNKRILGVREGASENSVVALGLLESLVERGLDPGRVRLFVLDGSKALRKASILALPSLAPNFQAARSTERAWSWSSLGRWPVTFRILWFRQRCTRHAPVGQVFGSSSHPGWRSSIRTQREACEKGSERCSPSARSD